jgi:hypothetical protein
VLLKGVGTKQGASQEQPEYRRSVFDRDYWLAHCQGFTVEGPEGRLGTVADVRFLSRLERPDVIVVRTGLLGRRRFSVPVDEVEEVVPDEQRVVLRAAPPAG